MIDLRWPLYAFFLSLVLTPLVKRYSIPCESYAHENERTVHHGKISRIGGVAIYVSFILILTMFFEVDRTVNGVVLGGSLMFFAGLVDDLIDLKPRIKLLLEVLAALAAIYFGVQVDVIRLPFGVSIDIGAFSIVFTLFWIVGITNAVNLIDGLDGLAGGFGVIVLVIIGSMAIIERRLDIMALALVLAGSILGFLVYNAHPASIFMGDCGSLFLGFMVSTISIMGFKSSTIMTLALPILILIIPIIDTLSAILRRVLKGQRFMQADKSHLHHLLMSQYGHRNTVLIICSLTALFGVSAFVYMINRNIGFMVMLGMLFFVELFIEKSAMISKHYHPLLSLYSGIWMQIRKFIGKIRK